MQSNQPTILFFDSGMGGLSVYQEVRKLLPDCHYLYCFDNAFFPYSEKSEALIIDRVTKICQRINEQYPLDMIVIACNTASTVVLEPLRHIFTIPVVGTVPAIKPAAEISTSKHIGLLATKGTVKRPYVDDLIAKYAADCEVARLGSTVLVDVAEQKLYGNGVDLKALQQELAPWQSLTDLDSVVLGCTHFPLIKQEIQQALPQVKHFLDSGEAIARRVKSLLQPLSDKNEGIAQANLMFCTKPFAEQQKLQQSLLHWGFEALQVLAI